MLSALGLSLGLGLAALAADSPPPVVATAEPVGMKVLFNGKDLSGWDGDSRLWSVKDGVIHGQTTAEVAAKGNTFLILKDQQFGDFALRFTARCNADNNSGVQYRSKHITEGKPNNGWVVRGYQHELRNESKLPNVAGFIYDEGGKRGRICHAGEKAVWEDGKKTTSPPCSMPQDSRSCSNSTIGTTTSSSPRATASNISLTAPRSSTSPTRTRNWRSPKASSPSNSTPARRCGRSSNISESRNSEARRLLTAMPC